MARNCNLVPGTLDEVQVPAHRCPARGGHWPKPTISMGWLDPHLQWTAGLDPLWAQVLPHYTWGRHNQACDPSHGEEGPPQGLN